MQEDFHYYATYCAAYISGYSHEESLEIAYSAQFVDCCSRTLLKKLKAPLSAATTQLQSELMNASTDLLGLQDITRIWASFHFLPGNLEAKKLPGCSKAYMDKYRLICKPNSTLLANTVRLAKGGSLQAAGIAMHVLADTWAHAYFAGTPSLVINNTDYFFYELYPSPCGYEEKPIVFHHNPTTPDDVLSGEYTNSVFQAKENSIMNLGHGRAGHLPDYSFIRYKYLPAWGQYEEVVKDNPNEYRLAFCQMITALKYLRGETEDFSIEVYDFESITRYEQTVFSILTKRQRDSSADWKAFGQQLSGNEIPDFSLEMHQQEYLSSNFESRDNTFLGRFFLAALAQKSMVTGKIFRSGNLLAGFAVDYNRFGFRGIKDFRRLADTLWKEARND